MEGLVGGMMVVMALLSLAAALGLALKSKALAETQQRRLQVEGHLLGLGLTEADAAVVWLWDSEAGDFLRLPLQWVPAQGRAAYAETAWHIEMPDAGAMRIWHGEWGNAAQQAGPWRAVDWLAEMEGGQ